MKETFTTHDGWTATVETVDGETQWTESGGAASAPQTYPLDLEDTLKVKTMFERNAEGFADDASFHAIFANSPAERYRLMANEFKELAAMLDRAAKEIA